jgi:hypothetical protein
MGSKKMGGGEQLRKCVVAYKKQIIHRATPPKGTISETKLW